MSFFDDYFFDQSNDTERYCYARVRRLREAEKDPAVVDAVLTGLKAPLNAAARKRMTPAEKSAALEAHVGHLQSLKGSEWRKSPAGEIFAAAIHLSKAPAKAKAALFSPVKQEEALRKPIRAWLERANLVAHDEVPMGTSRVDVVGYQPKTFWKVEHVVSVELKNQLSQLKRGLDQMTNYADYSHQVYLACTPALAASYLLQHFKAKEVGEWDPKALERKLEKFGIGLLLVEDETVYEVRSAKELSPAEKQLRELRGAIGVG